jgi:cytochrome b
MPAMRSPARSLIRQRNASKGHSARMKDGRRAVRVWDMPTRVFHWVTVALVAAAYATWRLNWMDWHYRVGEALLALVLFRLLWGAFGSETARFSRFLAAPRTVSRYLASWLGDEPDRQAGHNPAGGWMVLLLIGLLLVETLTGLYIANDVVDVGPLTEITPAAVADTIDRLHAILWNVLLAAVALHVLAIVAYAAAKRHNLILPMITGRKHLPEGVPAPRLAGSLRAALLLAACCAAAAALSTYL